MSKFLVSAAFVLGMGCGVALAQPVEGPAGVGPRSAPDAITAPGAAGVVAPRGEAVAPRPLNDPNTTGPDKINGLEVPQMKGEPPAVR